MLENGVISETGSHEELLEQNGTYATLFKLQASGYVDLVDSVTDDIMEVQR